MVQCDGMHHNPRQRDFIVHTCVYVCLHACTLGQTTIYMENLYAIVTTKLHATS